MLNMLIKKKVKSEEGQALLEFALVLPLILMILCGIIDFGWLFYNQLNVDNSVREAARSICVDCSTMNYDEVKNKAQTIVENNLHNKDMLPVDGVTVTYFDSSGNTLSSNSGASAEMVGVSVKINMPVLTFVMHAICRGDTRVVTSSATFRIEKSNATTADSLGG